MKRFLVLVALGYALAACGPAATSQLPNPAPQPTDLAEATLQSATSQPLRVEPTQLPTPAPTDVPATHTPLPPTPTPQPAPRVGIQVGHWQLEDMPDEQAKLRKYSGNYYRGYDEWEVNIEIARRVQQRLEAEGVTVDLLPATISPGYQADAFISIHADGTSTRPDIRRGWKLTAPWRASVASEALAAALSESYPRVTGLPQDTRGPSIDMLGYYAFAHYRYQHAIAPTTPAVIIEVGFMTNAADREIIFEQPDVVAQGIAEGVVGYLGAQDLTDTAARQPVKLPMLKPNGDNVVLRQSPNARGAVLVSLGANERLVPLGVRDGWYLATNHETWDVGWISESDVVTLDEPQVPPQ